MGMPELCFHGNSKPTRVSIESDHHIYRCHGVVMSTMVYI